MESKFVCTVFNLKFPRNGVPQNSDTTSMLILSCPVIKKAMPPRHCPSMGCYFLLHCCRQHFSSRFRRGAVLSRKKTINFVVRFHQCWCFLINAKNSVYITSGAEENIFRLSDDAVLENSLLFPGVHIACVCAKIYVYTLSLNSRGAYANMYVSNFASK